MGQTAKAAPGTTSKPASIGTRSTPPRRLGEAFKSWFGSLANIGDSVMLSLYWMSGTPHWRDDSLRSSIVINFATRNTLLIVNLNQLSLTVTELIHLQRGRCGFCECPASRERTGSEMAGTFSHPHWNRSFAHEVDSQKGVALHPIRLVSAANGLSPGRNVAGSLSSKASRGSGFGVTTKDRFQSPSVSKRRDGDAGDGHE